MHQDGLERADQLLAAQRRRHAVERELHKDAERDPDRGELQIGDLASPERGQLGLVDHQADEVEEQHLADQVHDVGDEGQPVAPGGEEVPPHEGGELHRLAYEAQPARAWVAASITMQALG